jgi:hypothetical protein
MADHDHKLFTTPVSVNDGFKRADGKSWAILGLAALAAIAIVALISLFVEKPGVTWPSSPARPAAQPEALPSDEPRTYDVAPPSADRQPAPAR